MIDLVQAGRMSGVRGGGAPDPEARNVDHVCLRIAPFDARALVAEFAGYGVSPEGPVASRLRYRR